MVEKILETPRPEVPQINSKNGISKDFVNQFAFLITLYDFKGLPQIAEHLKNRPFKAKKYAEVYERFREAVNDGNRETVAKLDETMTSLEEILQNPNNIDEEAFRQTINEAYFLVYGDRDVQI